jgi:hypothetical protein
VTNYTSTCSKISPRYEHLLEDLAEVSISRQLVGYFKSIREFNNQHLADLRSVAPSGSTVSSEEPTDTTSADDDRREQERGSGR